MTLAECAPATDFSAADAAPFVSSSALGGPGYGLSLSTNVASAPADGAASVNVTATLTDAGGRPLSGAPVVFSSSASANDTLSPVMSWTDCKGRARSAVSSNLPGAHTVTARRSVTQGSTTVMFSCPGPFLAAKAWPVYSTASNNGYGVDVADFNGDGNPDLVVSNLQAKKVHLFKGRGNGTFSPSSTLSLSGPVGSAFCDMNKDGAVDLVVVAVGDNSINVFLNDGLGNFYGPQTYASGSSPYFSACADVNKDGNMDVVVAGQNNNSSQLFLGNGDGTLQLPSAYAGGAKPHGVALTDLNGDSYPDAVVCNQNDNNITVYLNNQAGGFNAGVSFAVGYPTEQVMSADINNDGKMDIVVSRSLGASFSAFLGNGNGSLILTSTTSIPSNTYGFDVGDLDNDGNLDVVLAGSNAALVNVYRGNGDGTFTASASPSGVFASFNVRLADLNGDRNLDLIVPSAQGPASVAVYLGTGSGTFSPTFQIPTLGGAPYRLVMGKYPADSVTIFAYTVSGTDTWEVRRANGDGTFTAASTVQSINNPQEIILVDLNNDDRGDVLVISAGSNAVYTHKGNGDGSFAAANTYTTGSTPVNLTAGDFDKDGKPDVAVTNQAGSTVVVLKGNGDGTLQAAVAYGVGSNPRGVTTADLNGDGNLDLVVANSGSTTLSMALGKGDGNFLAPATFTVGAGPVNVVLVDLNGDGKLDLVTSLNGANMVGVSLGNNTTSPSLPTLYPTGSGPWFLSMADINGDGILDIVVPCTGDGNLSLLLGNGDGSFASAQSVASGTLAAGSVLLRDVNSDGRLDALVGTINGGFPYQIPLLLGSGCTVPKAGVQLAASANSRLTYTAGSVDVASSAELTPTNADTPSNAFAGSTLMGAAWDPNASQMRLGNSGGCNALTTNCARLDPSWTPNYANLIGYWPLDGSGTVAQNGSVAGVVGGALTVGGAAATYQAAQLSQGLNMATSGNAYLTLPSASYPAGPPFTVMGWLNWTGTADNVRIFQFGQSGNYLLLTPQSGTQMLLYAYANNSASYILANTSFPRGLNHFAAAVTASGMKAYVNGVLVGFLATSITTNMVSSASNVFGRSDGSEPPLAGTFDELAMFNVALDGNQIQQIVSRQAARFSGSVASRIFGPLSGMAWSDLAWSSSLPAGKPLSSGGVGESTGTYPDQGMASLSQGQALLWHLDESALGTTSGGRDARDDSGQANHGKVYNSVSLGQPGLLNGSYFFNGGTATMSSRYVQYNPSDLTVSAWFRTQSSAGGKIIGFGDASNGNSASYDRHIYLDSNSILRFGVSPGTNILLQGPAATNDGRWHHVTGTLGNNGLFFYVDGSLQASSLSTRQAQSFSGFWRLGGDNLGYWTGGMVAYLTGAIDEVAVYNRALSAAEVKQLWRRGANRLKFQVRACSSMGCADNPIWLGPDGSSTTYFSELNNSSLPLAGTGTILGTGPDMFFSSFSPGLSVPSNPYLQYRTIFESDDANALCIYNGVASPCSPELLSVRVGPGTYPSSGSVTSVVGTPLHSIAALTPTYGPGGCPGGVRFTLSNDGGTTWYFYNGYVWQAGDGTAATSNAPAQLTAAVLGAFVPQKGFGPISYRAFLTSSGTTPCSLAKVALSGGP